MVRHADVQHAGHPGDALPLGDPGRDRDIHVENIHRAREHQVAATKARDLALARDDWNPAGSTHLSQAAELIEPPDRLLKPAHVQALDRAAESDCIIHGPGLVGIAGDDEAVADNLPREAHPLGISAGVSRPTFSFMPAMPVPL